MSRIYQGGSADRRYEGRARGASYQPRQVASNEKELRQQGQQILQNLETKERERQRADQMSNLESASSARVAELNLQAEENAAAAQLQFQQNAEKMALQRVQMGETNLLKKTSMEGQNSLANNILEMKQNLQTNLLQQTHAWNDGNLDLKNKLSKSQLKQQQAVNKDILGQKNSLERMQLDQTLGQKQSQLIQSQNLQSSQLRESNAMKYDFMMQNGELSAEARALTANQALEAQHMRTEFVHERSALSRQQAGINALISFAEIGVKAAGMVGDWQATQRKEQEKQDLLDAEFGWLWSDDGSVIQSDGTINPAIGAEENLQTAETSYEIGVQNVAAGDPVAAEQIRQPGADQTMDRNLRQASIGQASQMFGPTFMDRLNDPNHSVRMPDGSVRTLTTARNEVELQYVLRETAKQITGEFGVSGKDKYAMLTSYGKQVKAAMNTAYSTYASQMRSANKAERYEAGISNATALAGNGNFQAAWNTARTAAITSGAFMNKSNKEINDAVLKDLMSRLPDSQLAELKNVRKIAGNKGSTFGQDRFYNDMIDDEIRARRNEVTSEHNSIQAFNNVEVKNIQNSVTESLYNAETAEDALAIRQEGVARLEALGTPEAIDAAMTMRDKGSLNNNVFLELVEGFDTGYPPTSNQIADAFASGAISHQQMNNLKQRGATGDLVDRKIAAANVMDPEDLAKSVISQALASKPGAPDASTRSQIAAEFVPNLAAKIKQDLRSFVVNNPDATPGQIQQEVSRIRQNLQSEVGMGTKDGLLKYDSETKTYTFDFDTNNIGRVLTRQNPITGKAQKVFTQSNVSQIPSSASTSDVFLSRQEYLADREILQNGGTEFSSRTRALAQKLGVSPQQFLRDQTRALGYQTIHVVPDTPTTLPASGNPSIQQGFRAIQQMGFPTRGAAYLAGNIMQESSWNGQRSWGEVQGDGSDRNGGLVSWMDGVAHNNFRLTKIENYLGKPIAQASSAEQLQAMKWEMQRDYKESYRIFMNPNSTDTQLRRASRLYWGYGHEGSRYSYAQSLL